MGDIEGLAPDVVAQVHDPRAVQVAQGEIARPIRAVGVASLHHLHPLDVHAADVDGDGDRYQPIARGLRVLSTDVEDHGVIVAQTFIAQDVRGPAPIGVAGRLPVRGLPVLQGIVGLGIVDPVQDVRVLVWGSLDGHRPGATLPSQL